mmetsp:Transcript_82036/g.217685  ORF Transcript_82036/g.217685 Transcript_82036/m.217685 type:complete len:284 (+) Transcript_82036:814-1665(+)
MGEGCLHHEAYQPIGVEDKVCARGAAAPQLRVHAPGLHGAGHQVEAGVDPAQVVDLQLGPYVLSDQIHRDGVVVHPRDDDVRALLAGEDILLERRLDEAGVLREDALHVAAPLHGVPPDPPGQAHVVVGVHEDPHVAAVHDLRDVQREDAFYDDDVRRVHVPRDVRPALAGHEVVDRHVVALAALQGVEAVCHRVEIEGVGLVKVHLPNVGKLLWSQVTVELVQAQQHDALVAQGLGDPRADSGLATCGAPSDANEEGLLRGNAMRPVGLCHGSVLHGGQQLC